jgi:hypothetical protein
MRKQKHFHLTPCHSDSESPRGSLYRREVCKQCRECRQTVGHSDRWKLIRHMQGPDSTGSCSSRLERVEVIKSDRVMLQPVPFLTALSSALLGVRRDHLQTILIQARELGESSLKKRHPVRPVPLSRLLREFSQSPNQPANIRGRDGLLVNKDHTTVGLPLFSPYFE